ncbi:glutamate-5-semialdehyde dehydrogenase [Candidatus Roizmanbacteria bacterium]|nr:glutamate-5-semialdehyde dehydrogenase [Candidatus Roizmanbacteria bacterium]
MKKASLELAQKTETEKNSFLKELASILKKNKKYILEENRHDLEKAREQNLSDVFLQRLTIDEKGINDLVIKVLEMQHLDAGIGEIIEQKIVGDGLLLHKIRVPIGVIAIIYEARPEVTVDVAALCIKSGNVAILKGGSEAMHTNIILYKCILKALKKTGFRKETINFITSTDRKNVLELLTRSDLIDLVIARGSYAMVENIQKHSSIPVLAHSAGGARIYIDKSADLSIVEKIIINAKVTKPSACNSLNTIIIHKELMGTFLKAICKSLTQQGVALVKNDWTTEFLDMRVSIKVVADATAAIKFINKYGNAHSEGIIASDPAVIALATSQVDTAALFINCSPRLHDGYVFGLGSEMGIATGKLHASGPVGLKELTIYKWIAYGKGHIRE